MKISWVCKKLILFQSAKEGVLFIVQANALPGPVTQELAVTLLFLLSFL